MTRLPVPMFLSVPMTRETACELLATLNADDGYRNFLADQMEHATQQQQSKRADAILKQIMALGQLSATISAAQPRCSPPRR